MIFCTMNDISRLGIYKYATADNSHTGEPHHYASFMLHNGRGLCEKGSIWA